MFEIKRPKAFIDVSICDFQFCKRFSDSTCIYSNSNAPCILFHKDAKAIVSICPLENADNMNHFSYFLEFSSFILRSGHLSRSLLFLAFHIEEHLFL